MGKVGRLVGTDGIQKMSKSLGNSILITDTPKQVKKKLGKIYVGVDNRQPNDPGEVDPEKNPLFQYVETFIDSEDEVTELRDRYSRGDNIGDGVIKVRVAEAISELLEPMQERRRQYESDDVVMDILHDGCRKAIAATEETLALAKEAASLRFFDRAINL